MRTFSNEELNEILENHKSWMKSFGKTGTRANLSDVDLSGANLSGADLRNAILRDAILRDADLMDANLSYANLRDADLSYAILSGAILRDAILRDANLSGAILSGANLRDADLSYADLSYAILSGAILRDAILRDANLSGAILSSANLRDADLSGVKNLNIHLACPEEGSFIAFKKCRGNLIVKLEITEDAFRSSSTGRKCRCSKAKVVSITNIDGTYSESQFAVSKYDSDFIYRVGEIVEVKNFDANRFNECSPGIHFFITREEAVNY